jgi:hypothetical protein
MQSRSFDSTLGIMVLKPNELMKYRACHMLELGGCFRSSILESVFCVIAEVIQELSDIIRKIFWWPPDRDSCENEKLSTEKKLSPCNLSKGAIIHK